VIPAGIAIRPMSRSDLPEVVAIEHASFPSPWSERTFRNLLRRRNTDMIVACSPLGDVVGYAVTWFAGAEAELGDLAVHPAARRNGVGQTLLDAAVRAAVGRSADAIFLEVRVSNEGARALYRDAGFRETGVRPGYYVDPSEDAIVMRLSPLTTSRSVPPDMSGGAAPPAHARDEPSV